MKKLILLGNLLFIGILLFALNALANDATVTIADAHINKDCTAVVSGRISSGENKQVTCLVLGADSQIAYIDQITSQQNGAFTFNFKLPKNSQYSTYTVKCGGTDVNFPAQALMTVQEPLVDNHFAHVTATVNVNASNIIISGTATVYDNKKIAIDINNMTDNTVIADSDITRHNSNFNFTYKINNIHASKEYHAQINVTDIVSKTPVCSLNLNFNTGPLLISAEGRSTVGDNVRIIGHLTSTNSDLLDKSVTISTDKSFDFSLPNVVISTYNLDVDCYDKKTAAQIENEAFDISENDSPLLYNALKSARPSLDSDDDGIIEVYELASLTGCVDLSNKNLTDINGLQALSGITDLYLCDNKIENISPLAQLNNLRLLDLHNNKISLIRSIPTGLTVLNLEHNKLVNIDVSADCLQLKYLYLGYNDFISLNFVKRIPQLQFLSAPNNMLTEITVLSFNTTLRYLDLSNNCIRSVEALSNNNALYDLRLSNNLISDISMLPQKKYFNLFIDQNSISAEQIYNADAIIKKY